MWSLVKDFVGKGDLSKIATPVQLLEPLSELQQRCEDLEYTELLDQASPWPINAYLGRTCTSSGRVQKACAFGMTPARSLVRAAALLQGILKHSQLLGRADS